MNFFGKRFVNVLRFIFGSFLFSSGTILQLHPLMIAMNMIIIVLKEEVVVVVVVVVVVGPPEVVTSSWN